MHPIDEVHEGVRLVGEGPRQGFEEDHAGRVEVGAVVDVPVAVPVPVVVPVVPEPVGTSRSQTM